MIFKKISNLIPILLFANSCSSMFQNNKYITSDSSSQSHQKIISHRYPNSESNQIVDFYNSSSEEILSQILNSNNSNSLSSYLESLTDLYIVNSLMLDNFDQLLDQRILSEKKLLEINSYQKLLSGWSIREHIQEQITEVLAQLLFVSSDTENSQQKIALNILNETYNTFKKIIDSKSFKIIPKAKDPYFNVKAQLRKLVLQDLLSEIQNHFTEVLSSIKAKPDSLYVKRLNNFIRLTDKGILNKKDLITLNNGLLNFIKEHKKDPTVIAKAQWAFDLVQNLELDNMSSNDENSNLQIDDRTPQQVKARLCPSADSSGNITGQGFPKNTWALTLDDGPHKTYTDMILNTAKKNNIKISFFWLSKLSPLLANQVSRAKSEGHTLANHSFSHANLPKLSQSGLQQEIIQSTTTHTQVYGFKPHFFRCPYGACGSNGSTIRQMIAQQKMLHVFWNIDSLDWQDKNPASVTQRVLKQFNQINSKNSGGIILYHDIHAQSAASIEEMVPILKNYGVQFKSMDEIVSLANGGAACE